MQQPDEVDLISWPDGPNGGPRLLGRTDDPEVVAYVRSQILAERRGELARLAGQDRAHLRPLPDPGSEDAPAGDGDDA